MELTIPRTSEDPLNISLEMGQQLYVVGPNGTGKSALFQHWVSSMGVSAIKRIAAHRQTWLPSGDLNFTAQSRKQFEQNSRQWDSARMPGGKSKALLNGSQPSSLIWWPKTTPAIVLLVNTLTTRTRMKRLGSPLSLCLFSSNSMTCFAWEL